MGYLARDQRLWARDHMHISRTRCKVIKNTRALIGKTGLGYPGLLPGRMWSGRVMQVILFSLGFRETRAVQFARTVPSLECDVNHPSFQRSTVVHQAHAMPLSCVMPTFCWYISHGHGQSHTGADT